MSAHPDTSYLIAFCENNRLKVSEVYHRCFPSIAQYISRNNGSLSDAENVYHDVLIDLIHRFCVEQNFTLTTSICSFLGYACKMRWLKTLSRKKPVDPLIETVRTEYKDVAPSIESQIIEDEERRAELQRLNAVRHRLSDGCQQLIQLIVQGLSSQEIMEQMQYKSTNVLYASKARCMKKLTELYFEKER